MKAHLDQAAVNATPASLAVSHKASKKDEEKKSSALSSEAQATRVSKKKRLSNVQNDIQTPKSSSAGSSSSNAPSSSGGLFGGDRQHWEADPLTLFMFENAPVIIELCQRSQEAMTEAQVTQTQLQGQNALQNAQDTAQKGQEQAEQQTMRAAGEFAQAGLATLQGALQTKDLFSEDDTYTKDLEAHENVVNSLNKSSAENETTVGGVRAEGANGANEPGQVGADALTDEEREMLRSKAKEFKRVHQEKYTEALEKQGSSWKTKIKKSFFGLGRSEEWVHGENEVLANRKASAAAYDDVLSKPSGEYDPQIFEGSTTKAKEAHKVFMKELFNEHPSGVDDNGNPKFDQPALSGRQRMELVGDWGRGARLQKRMLQSYGATEEGAKMKLDLEGNNGCLKLASDKANIEMAKNKRAMDTRQHVLQSLMGQSFNSLFDFLQKQYIIAASQAESSATIESSLAQLYGQAKSAEESFVQNSIKDMTGIYEWFQSMHGQLLSAQTAMASA